MAAANAPSALLDGPVAAEAAAPPDPPTAIHPTVTSAMIASAFITISALWTFEPARTPRQLIAVRTMRVIVARTDVGTAIPLSSRKYVPKVIATAAMPPV